MTAQSAPRNLAWDDLRILLALARGGSLSAAARRLGVNHTTVFRRLDAFEGRLGVRVFERHRTGYVATAAGADILRTAERVEAEMQSLERRLAGHDHRLSGTVRLTAPDDIVENLLTPALARFHTEYPDIKIEVVVDNRMLSLTRREANIAVRPTRDPPETLVGRRVADLTSAVYGSTRLGASRAPGSAVDLGALPWVAWEEGTGPRAVTRWLEKTVAADAIAYRSNSMLNLLAAVRAGLGLGVLPCFLADAAADLQCVRDPDSDLTTRLWLLTHPDLRRTARVRVLMDFLYADPRAGRARLERA